MRGCTAGGVVAGGGVWAVLGHKTAGKSTMLAWLALSGLGVVSDDVLVIDDGTVLAGPRSIDLRGRPPSGSARGAARPCRRPLALAPAARPGRGGAPAARAGSRSSGATRSRSSTLRGAERLAALLPHRGVRLAPTEPSALLRLSALPHLRLIRPRRWESLPT